MATLIVTTTNASGAGSFADALILANGSAGADTIVFAKALAGQTIALAGDLALSNGVTINGDTNNDGDADITINVNNGRLVNNAGSTATLSSLVLTSGYGFPDGSGDAAGAVFNRGTLALNYVHVSNNIAYSVYGRGLLPS